MTKIIEESTKKRLHLPYLDGLRGLASLYIVLVHIEPSIEGQLPILWLLFGETMKYGAFSVVIFIVLSGYVLMLPVARSENGQLSGSFMNYIKKRSRRILPPYYIILFICFCALLPVLPTNLTRYVCSRMLFARYGNVTHYRLLVLLIL
jgi:peptidoglycan/LPS O-acetylase OafA/YrhL